MFSSILISFKTRILTISNIDKGAVSVSLFKKLGQEDADDSIEAAPKTGFPRLWELVSRDLWDNFRAGFLALLGCISFAVGLSFSVLSHSLIFVPVLGLIGGAIAGPELCALADTLLRGQRDEASFWWHTYRKAWKRSAKSALLPGAVSGLLLAFQLFLFIFAEDLELEFTTMVALVMGTALLLGLSLYLWPQLALMQLSFGQLLKNSALLFLGRLSRSIAALAVLATYIGLSIQFSELALALLPFLNLWLPAFLALFIIYPVLEDTFKLEVQFHGEKRSPQDN